MKEVTMKNNEVSFIMRCLDKFYKNEKIFFEEQPKNLNWEYIERISKKNKILPIINKVCNCKYGISNEMIEEIHKKRSIKFQKIIKEFEKKGINYAVLKGAYLSQIAYKTMDARFTNDIDILIPVEKTKQVKSICESRGWESGKVNRDEWKIIKYGRKEEIAFKLNTHQLATMANIFYDEDLGYFDCVLDFNVKLTWGGYSKKEISLKEPLDKVQKITDSFGSSYNVLDKEWFLIQLCLHLFKEENDLFFIYNNEGLFLRGFLDIYYYIKSIGERLSLGKIFKIAKDNDIYDYLYYVFWYLDQLFEENIVIKKILIELSSKANNKIIVEGFGIDKEYRKWEVSVLDRFFLENIIEEYKLFTTDEINSILIKKNDFY